MEKIFEKLNNPSPEIRIEGLLFIRKIETFDNSIIDKVIDLLGDDWDENKRGSAFGPTGIVPEIDLPVAKTALETLMVIGEKAIPKLLKLINEYPLGIKEYMVVIALGRLRSTGALKRLTDFALDNTIIHNRVNFDQVDELSLYEKAAQSIYQISPEYWDNFVRNVKEGSDFDGRIKKYMNKEYLISRICQLDQLVKNSQ